MFPSLGASRKPWTAAGSRPSSTRPPAISSASLGITPRSPAALESNRLRRGFRIGREAARIESEYSVGPGLLDERQDLRPGGGRNRPVTAGGYHELRRREPFDRILL